MTEKIKLCYEGENFVGVSSANNMCYLDAGVSDLECYFFNTGPCPNDDCTKHKVIWIKEEQPINIVKKSTLHLPLERVQTIKDTNPKDAVGVTKAPLSVLPMQVVYEAALGMYEGALKYGAFNYRIAGVRASVYYDAVQRHMNQWWEGEDIDPDSGLSHVTKAITTLMVLRDAMLNDKFNDDRPPKVLDQSWMKNYNEKVKQLQAKYPEPVPRYTWKVNQ